MLEDGSYEGLIVDAEVTPEGEEGVLRVEIAISSGRHKGEVVAVRGRFPGRSDIDLLAAPAVLVVADGEPAVHLDE
jgi:hypothetical protein